MAQPSEQAGTALLLLFVLQFTGTTKNIFQNCF